MLGHIGHDTLKALREGKVIDLEGLHFVMDEGDLALGDTYIGARNTVDIYTCKDVDIDNSWVVPEGSGYLFDIWECIKVCIAETDATADYVVPAECFTPVATSKK